MNRVALAALLSCALVSVACTALQPIEALPDEVQHRILAGRLLQPGDRVRLVTEDEAVHKFRVTEVDIEQGLVIGADEAVPVSKIVAAETREVSIGRTAVLVGGVGTGLAVLIAIAIAPAVILSGG